MSILYINHYAGSLKHGMEFRPFYMAREWVKSGEKVLMIASSFSHLRSVNPDVLGEQDVDGVKYFWLWGNKYKGNGVARFISMLLFILQLIVLVPYFVIKYRPKIVIASSTYPLDIFPAKLMALFTGARVVFEIHDLWPMSPQELSGMPSWHPFIMLMKIGEWCSYKLADKVVSIPTKTYSYVKDFGVSESNFLHVPNGVDLSVAESTSDIPSDLSVIVSNAKSNGCKVIGYAGALGVANSMDIIIDVFKLLDSDNVVLVLVGGGAERENLINRAGGAKKIYFYDRINKEHVVGFLKACDLLIYSMKDTPLYKYPISLNKVHEYMLAAKPIIQIAGIKDTVVAKSGAGFEIDCNIGLERIAAEIRDICSKSADELEAIGIAGESYVKRYHDYAILAHKFLDFINKS